MESDKKKLFVGGLVRSTTADSLRLYFNNYGVVESSSVYFNRSTGISRGFGFVSFSDLSSAENALRDTDHVIDGKKVQINVARSRIEPQHMQHNEGFNSSNIDGSNKKIFVGGLAHNITHEAFRTYFLQFGAITDAVVIHDKATNLSRGFGFITFASSESFTSATQCRFHTLGDKLIDVKPAIPKEFLSTYVCNGFFAGFNYGGCSPNNGLMNGSRPIFYGYNPYGAPQNYVPVPDYSQYYGGYDYTGCYVGPQHGMLYAFSYNPHCCTSYSSYATPMVKIEAPPICNKATELKSEEMGTMNEVARSEVTTDSLKLGEIDLEGHINDLKVERDSGSTCEDVDYQDGEKGIQAKYNDNVGFDEQCNGQHLQTIMIQEDNSDLSCEFAVTGNS